MTKGALQLAGPFLDDSGGLILYNAREKAEVRAIAEHDPGVVDGILAVELIRPFRLAFDAARSSASSSPLAARRGHVDLPGLAARRRRRYILRQCPAPVSESSIFSIA
jgi:YCII-related domain